MLQDKVKNISEYIEEYLTRKTNRKGEVLNFSVKEGLDVYNCSIPFTYEGKTYIWGRVEKRQEWATSVTMLFEQKEDGRFVRAENSEVYPIEDPFFQKIGNEFVLGGVHVVKEQGKIKTYYNYFYRGTSPFEMKYFTTGPDYMKDIRLIELSTGGIGVFSRPRNDEIMEKYGTVSQIGYTRIDSLDELTAEVIEHAAYIPDLFAYGEWGGVNQTVDLGGGLIGMIGHQGYPLIKEGTEYPVYVNMAYVYHPKENKILEKKVIGVRSDYPKTDNKLPTLALCAFTSGIGPLKDGKVALYSGLGDAHEGWIEIPDPFAAYR